MPIKVIIFQLASWWIRETPLFIIDHVQTNKAIHEYNADERETILYFVIKSVWNRVAFFPLQCGLDGHTSPEEEAETDARRIFNIILILQIINIYITIYELKFE